MWLDMHISPDTILHSKHKATYGMWIYIENSIEKGRSMGIYVYNSMLSLLNNHAMIFSIGAGFVSIDPMDAAIAVALCHKG